MTDNGTMTAEVMTLADVAVLSAYGVAWAPEAMIPRILATYAALQRVTGENARLARMHKAAMDHSEALALEIVVLRAERDALKAAATFISDDASLIRQYETEIVPALRAENARLRERTPAQVDAAARAYRILKTSSRNPTTEQGWRGDALMILDAALTTPEAPDVA